MAQAEGTLAAVGYPAGNRPVKGVKERKRKTQKSRLRRLCKRFPPNQSLAVACAARFT